MSEVKTVTPVVKAGASVYDVPASVDTLLHQAFSIQAEYVNEAEFRVMAIEEALRMYAKYNCNATVAEFERLIAKTQKLHSEFNREQALEFIRKTRSGKELEELATLAEALKTELS